MIILILLKFRMDYLYKKDSMRTRNTQNFQNKMKILCYKIHSETIQLLHMFLH